MRDFFRRVLWRLRSFIVLSPVTVTLSIVCIAVYAMQTKMAGVWFLQGYTFGDVFTTTFGLNWTALSQGFWWQPFSSIFLHSGWTHVLLNVATIILFGAAVEREIGGSRYFRAFVLGGIMGGFGWLGVTAALSGMRVPSILAIFPQDVLNDTFAAMPMFKTFFPADGVSVMPALTSAYCVGASGGVCALLGLYAAMFPTRRLIVFLLFFPIRMNARTLVLTLLVLSLLGPLLVPMHVAHAAHIGGGVAGYFYGLYLMKRWGGR